MIIEIKDLPLNRKIRHISFDIDFEDTENNEKSQNSVKIDTFSETSLKSNSYQNKETVKNQQVNEKSQKSKSIIQEKSEIPDVSIDNREAKEIPAEMTDIEF